jgi:hypothetical protein
VLKTPGAIGKAGGAALLLGSTSTCESDSRIIDSNSPQTINIRPVTQQASQPESQQAFQPASQRYLSVA